MEGLRHGLEETREQRALGLAWRRIDVDLSDSEDEEEKKRKEQQQAEEELAQRRLLVDSCGYRQGVARSFSY